ncbi:MAG: sugar transferase [Planctomycetota bacterium]
MKGPAGVYIAAAMVAVSWLLSPLVGRMISRRMSGVRKLSHRSMRYLVLAALIVTSAAIVSVALPTWSSPASDTLILLALTLTFAFGVSGRLDRFSMPMAGKLITQLVLAVTPVLMGIQVPSSSILPVPEPLVTVLFILGVMNLLSVLNFIDGLSAIFVFITAACLALVFDFTMQSQGEPDSNGIVFAIVLCGGSLAFFNFRRPMSRSYMAHVSTVLLSYTLALLLVRAWTQMGNAGGTFIDPVTLLPLVLILPILAASVHRENMALQRRQRLALILIVAGHLPIWFPFAYDAFANMTAGSASTGPAATGGLFNEFVRYTLLGVTSSIVWAAFIARGRTIRGWSLRVMSEPIADLIRITLVLTPITTTIAYMIGLNIWLVIGANLFTSAFLILQVTVWRRRYEAARPLPHVVVFGEREEYEETEAILRNCADLLGRQKFSRSRVPLDSPMLRRAVLSHLRNDETVLVLHDTSRPALSGLRAYGDLVFASDSVVLRQIDKKNDLKRISPLIDLSQDFAHRAIALLGLIALLPVFLLIMAIIKLDDNGPVFFRQRRIGRDHKRFRLYKFRSMRVDAPKYGESPREGRDPRVTRVGYWLRKLSLDELPQLINVVRGEMRLVGPRPEMPFICSKYKPRERKRLDVPPGITGLWQVSPHRNDPIHDHVEYDLAYRYARSPILDSAILIATVLGGAKEGY